MNKDIRWIQRFANFELVLAELTDAVAILKQRKFTQLEEQGLIQSGQDHLKFEQLKNHFNHTPCCFRVVDCYLKKCLKLPRSRSC